MYICMSNKGIITIYFLVSVQFKFKYSFFIISINVLSYIFLLIFISEHIKSR